MKVYLLRHAHRGHGEDQDTLTDIGREQVQKTRSFFKEIRLDKIICGNKNRARETGAGIIADHDCDVVYTDEVNERELGVFEKKSGREWKDAITSSGLSEEEFKPEGGETRRETYERAKKFYEQLQRESAENVLVVSHAGFISDLITFMLELPEEENINFKTGFCAISTFEFDEGFTVRSFSIGELKHLAGVKKVQESENN